MPLWLLGKRDRAPAGRVASTIRARWPWVAGMLDVFTAGATLVAEMARGRRAGIVLLYHRIAPSAGDPSIELVPAVSLATFRRQMRWVRRFFRVVPAGTLPAAISGRRIWQRFPVAVTFDDENPEHVAWALPVLSQTRVDATFFLTGRCLDDPGATWWELLQGAVDAGLPVERLVGEGNIHEKAERVKVMQPKERHELVRVLEHMGAKPPNRAMTPEELLAIASRHEVGFHTLHHDFLPVLSFEDLESALRDGRDSLGAALGRRLELLAYPHGGAKAREAAAARGAGYRLGFTTASRGWNSTMDPMRIGRTEIGEESVGVMARRLADLLTGAT